MATIRDMTVVPPIRDRTIRYCPFVAPEGSAPRWSAVVSRREARLLFWLVVLALVGIVFVLYSESLSVLATPAIILFVAWLMSYVLEPPVSFVQRHLPFRGRGVAVAITYLVTAVIAFVVIAGAGVAVINAAVAFIDNLPAILSRLGELLTPLVGALGLSTPGDGSVVAKIQEFVAENAGEIADGITALARNSIVVVASLVTAVIISVGLAMGQVSLLGWLRRFLPSSTYRDLTELEAAIAVSFGGFVRGRLVIGAIYGAIIALSAVVLGIPYAPLIAVIAGLIVFIPWIGPLIGWAVLPAFALILAPAEVAPAAAISIAGGDRHPGRGDPVRDGRRGQDGAGRGLRRGHPRHRRRRRHRGDLRHPDRGGDPGHHGLPARTGRPAPVRAGRRRMAPRRPSRTGSEPDGDRRARVPPAPTPAATSPSARTRPSCRSGPRPRRGPPAARARSRRRRPRPCGCRRPPSPPTSATRRAAC